MNTNTKKQQHTTQNLEQALNEILAYRDVANVTCFPIGPNHYMMEVHFKYSIISYECLSSVLHKLRRLLGQQSVSRFYSFASGTLRVALTPDPSVKHMDRLDFEDDE